MYPWQSADLGIEETQSLHFNPQNNSWGPDNSTRQRHVGIAIFYNMYKHFENTGKLPHEFAETMIEIARFFVGIAKKNAFGRYTITGVMGPNEFHEAMPRHKVGGLKNNAYTNIMVSWMLEVLLELPNLDSFGVSEEEQELFDKVSRRLNISMKRGIIEQYEGFMKLKRLDFAQYRKKYGKINRMDRILKAEGKNPDNYQVIKQPDALMAFYLLGLGKTCEILKRLGVSIKDNKTFLKKQYEYYVARTTHGSTISYFVHNAILNKFSHDDSTWEIYEDALESDIYDTQGGTTPEGIHSAVMAGTLVVARENFAGILLKDEVHVRPRLPKHWKDMKLHLKYKGIDYNFAITHKKIKVVTSKKVTMYIKGKKSEGKNHLG
jgi:trehalose/maltose hydrolase-like predicted phosphorylase